MTAMPRNYASRERHDTNLPCERGNNVGTRAVCGYLRKGFLMTATEIGLLRRMILDCAAAHGLSVDAIYEEELDRVSEQLVDCIDAILDADEPVMIVPSLLHLASFGNPLEVRSNFQGQGIRVLIAQNPSPQS